AVAAAAGAALPRQRPARAAWRGVTACFTKPLSIWDSEAYGCFVEANKGDIRRLSQAVTALTTAAARGMSRAFDVHRVGALGLAATRGGGTPTRRRKGAAGPLHRPGHPGPRRRRAGDRGAQPARRPLLPDPADCGGCGRAVGDRGG